MKTQTRRLHFDTHVHLGSRETLHTLEDVAERAGVEGFFGICNDVDVAEYAASRPLPFVAVWTVSDLANPDVPDFARGIKLHPRSGWEISSENLAPIAPFAAKRNLPMFFHTDMDRPPAATAPALGRVAVEFPDAIFVAVHVGGYLHAYFEASKGQEYTASEHDDLLESTIREVVQQLLDVPNFYADTAAFGCIDPARDLGKWTKFTIMRDIVSRMTPAEQQQLCGKLFVGTDFPCFMSDDHDEWTLRYQLARMDDIFGSAFSGGTIPETLQQHFLGPDDGAQSGA